MCSPVGHSIAALAVGCGATQSRLTWQFVLFCLVSGNAPDLDMLIGWAAGDINGYHHLGSHSLFAAMLYGMLVYAVISLLTRDTGIRMRYATSGFLIWVSHVVLDMLSEDHSEPVGMQLLWPFSQEFFAFPFSPFPAFHHDTIGGDMAGMIIGLLSMDNAVTVFHEVMILGPLLLLVLWARRRVLFSGLDTTGGPADNRET